MSNVIPMPPVAIAKNPNNTNQLVEASVSAVMTAYDSALAYFWKYVLGEREEETDAMREGTAVHSLLLEPEKFYASYFTDEDPPEGTSMLKTVADLTAFLDGYGIKIKGKKEDQILGCRAQIAKLKLEKEVLIYDDWFAERTVGRIHLSRVKWDRLHLMKDRVLKHKFVAKYLPMGTKEFRLEGEVMGVYMRGQLDWLVNEAGLPYIICIDVKKVKSAKFLAFRRAIEDSGLHVQAASYTALVKKIFKRECLFVWVAIEAKAPFHCEVYSANDAVISAGEVDARHAIKRILDGYQYNVWPGYSNGDIQNMDLSNFQYDKTAERAIELEDDDEDEGYF